MNIKRLMYFIFASIFILVLAVPALAGISVVSIDGAEKGAKKITEAVRVVEEIIALREEGGGSIPSRVLGSIHGIAIIPNAFKASLGVGGRYGKGVMLVRREDNSWSEPIFIIIAGGSLGWQVGVQSTDIILVFNEAKSVKNVSKGKLTFGVDATIAAGDLGRHIEASTDERAKAEIYSYSRSKGLFIGVSLEGGVLRIDKKRNSAYYGSKDIGVEDIIAGKAGAVSALTRELKRVVRDYVSK